MTSRMVTDEEQKTWSLFWQRHEESLYGANNVSLRYVRYLNILTQPDSIGYGTGKIRPGKIGKVDVYFVFSNLRRTPVMSLILSDLLHDFWRYRGSLEKHSEMDDDIKDFIQSLISQTEESEETESCCQAA